MIRTYVSAEKGNSAFAFLLSERRERVFVVFNAKEVPALNIDNMEFIFAACSTTNAVRCSCERNRWDKGMESDPERTIFSLASATTQPEMP